MTRSGFMSELATQEAWSTSQDDGLGRAASARVSGPILIVENDGDTRAMLRHLLEDDGYTVLDAKDGRQAIDLLVLLGAADPALVVLDLRLPIASGSELLEVMRSYFRLSSIPVLVLSGTDMGRETRETSSSVAYLPKPLDLPRFLAIVGERATRVTSRLH